jgi:hypothetical protein
MQRFISFLGALTVLLGVGGSASAGYWEVEYDLAGSTVQTIVTLVGTTDVDPLTGSFTIQYTNSLSTPSAAITGARLVAGAQQLVMFQTNLGLFLLTGTIDTVLNPPPGGTPGVINSPNLTLATVADSSVMGFIHCHNGAFNCTAANFTHTVPKPQTPTVPGPFPVNLGAFVFTGGVGTSDFTGTGATQTVPGTPVVTLVTTYVGKELSRTFHANGVPAGSNASRIALGLVLLLGGASGLALQRSRRTRQAG